MGMQFSFVTHKSTASTQRGGVSLFLAALLAGAVLVGGQPALAQTSNGNGCNTSDATAPCFAQIQDILAGRRVLLPNDDLVFGFSQQPAANSGPTIFGVYTLESSSLDFPTTDVRDFEQSEPNCFVGEPESESMPAPINTRIGRLFNTNNDVVVTLTPTGSATGPNCFDGNSSLFVLDPLGKIETQTVLSGFRPSFTGIALDDFDFDGFEEIFVIVPFVDSAPGAGPVIEIYSAADHDDFNAGLERRSSLTSNGARPLVLGAPVTGDFNGDGIRDVAWIAATAQNEDLTITAVSICPDKDVEVLGETCSAALQPIQTSVSLSVAPSGLFSEVALAAGNFDGLLEPTTGRATSELVYFAKSNEQGVLATAISFTPDFDANVRSPQVVAPFVTNVQSFFSVASGPLVSTAQKEQAVVAFSNPLTGDTTEFGVSVINFDENLNMTIRLVADAIPNNFVSYLGAAIGRFDPPNQPDGAIDGNQQIAILLTDILFDDTGPVDSSTQIHIYTIDPANDFTPKFTKASVFSDTLLLDVFSQVDAPLQSGDFQGRSLRLGPPEKVKVSGHIQPNFVIGVPPMHVDYIPLIRGGVPEIVNVSVAAEIDESGADDSEFNTTYTFSTSSSRNTSQQSTISTTASTKTDADAKVSYGIPDIASVSVSVMASAENTSSNDLGLTLSFKNKNTSSLTRSTGLSDLVWFQKKDFFIYIYPVIGQTVCPEDKPNCSESERLPLQVHFSGPDEIQINLLPAQNILMGANNLEFYQPPHQPLNLLSYPWSLETLENSFPRAAALTDKDPSFQEPGNSPGTFSSTWSQSSGSEQSVGASNNHSFDSSVSVSAGVEFDGAGADASGTVDKSGSTAISTLTTTKSTVSVSEGVTVTIPALDQPNTWKASTFKYELGAFIFGQNEIPNTLDSSEPDTDLKTRGVQRIGFAAQATADFWGQIYNEPDLALNHPNRWNWDNVTMIASPTKMRLDNIQQSSFHAMRGFFVTSQGAGAKSPVGSQTTVISDNEEVTLWTRVHNFSQVPIDSDTTIHVRFFGQVFDSTIETCPTNVNCSFVGPSFEIGTADRHRRLGRLSPIQFKPDLRANDPQLEARECALGHLQGLRSGR